MNRAVGKRAMFESDADVHRFLDRVALITENGSLEVHAYAVLQTHYHFLAFSPCGELSEAMHFIQGPYAQWFNRARDRDGPIHRGRFLAKPVESLAYRRVLVSYIDANPVLAGLIADPGHYPHCSAHDYARPTGPAWLSRHWIEGEVNRRSASRVYDPAFYPSAFPRLDNDARRELVVADVGGRSDQVPPLDFLLGTTTEGRARWLQERARHADGTRALRPVVTRAAVLAALRVEDLSSTTIAHQRTSFHSPHNLAAVVLLRQLAGSSKSELADTLGCSLASIRRLIQRAARLLDRDSAFRDSVTAAATRALTQFYAPWGDVPTVASMQPSGRKVPGTFRTDQ